MMKSLMVDVRHQSDERNDSKIHQTMVGQDVTSAKM
jgi:hypothetical protein